MKQATLEPHELQSWEYVSEGVHGIEANIESKGIVKVPGLYFVEACNNPMCKWSTVEE